MSIPWDRLALVRDIPSEAREIAAMRGTLGLTQQQMATILDVSTSTYYRWETGKGQAWFCALELMRCWIREVNPPGQGNAHGESLSAPAADTERTAPR